MINYELAKQLKEAGFPQAGEHLDYDRCPYMIYPNDIDDGVSKNGCYDPTLSELIEQCGERFGYLTQYDRYKGEGWFAGGHKIKWESDELGDIKCEGETPEEAVVNLWLKLNESKRDTTTRKD